MLNTKNVAGFLAPLAPHVATLYAVTIPGEQNALRAHKIAGAARSVDLPAHEAPSSAAIAVGAIVADPTPARILICGSLHLAGVVLAENG
jgi:dihydrofolate synthase / folylpolyglutamate synthase